MTSNRIAYTGFVAFVSVVLTLMVVNMVQSSPEPTPASTGANGENVYRLDQVAEHNNANSCWKVIGGVVYDLTEYLPNHPTEEETFTRWCGKEATAAWQDKGDGRPHSPRAAARLESYRVGVIEGKSLTAIFRLYQPETVVDDIDGFSGASLRGAKVLSAFRDGLNRGVYSW